MESVKKLRQFRLKKHLCYICGKKLSKSDSRINCPKCREDERIKRLKRIKARVFAGEKVRPRGRPRKATKVKLKKVNKKLKQPRWTKEEEDYLRDNRTGKTAMELSKVVGRTWEATKKKIQELGLKRDDWGKKKGTKPKAKATKGKKITVNIPLVLERQGDSIVCDNISAVMMVLGSSSVVGNFSLFRVVKTNDGKFTVPIETIKRRVKLLEDRIVATEKKLAIMHQIVG